MNRIQRHRPGFFEGFEEDTDVIEFVSVEELLAVPWIKAWAKDPGFRRFSISMPPGGEGNWLLMAEYDDGKRWFVVGYLDKRVELPMWEKP